MDVISLCNSYTIWIKMTKDKQQQTFKFRSKAIILNKLLAFIFVFLLGHFWARTGPSIEFLIILIICFFLVILNVFYSIIDVIIRKQILLANKRIESMLELSRIRIQDWYQILKVLETPGKNLLENLESVRKKGLLDTKNSVAKAVSMIGFSFSRESVNEYTAAKKKIDFTVVYLQKGEDGKTLHVRSRERIFPYTGSTEENCTKSLDYRFSKNDGSTAGWAWATESPVFISNTEAELNRPEAERRFISVYENEFIKSICCIPIKYKDVFFGVLCVHSNSIGAIKESDTYEREILKRLEPIRNQLILIDAFLLFATN